MSQGFVTLTQAKEHLSIDQGLTVHDVRVQDCIDGAVDYAENYTQRSLGELLELNSPTDSSAVPLPDPKDSPASIDFDFIATTSSQWGSTFDWTIGVDQWGGDQTQAYWAAFLAANPAMQDQSKPLRRDVRQAILLQVEIMFDRNVANYQMLTQARDALLQPYRIALGV